MSLSDLDEIDHRIIHAAMARHFDKIEIVTDNTDVDFIFTRDLIPSTPYKIGQILDIIEANYLKINFKAYSLMLTIHSIGHNLF